MREDKKTRVLLESIQWGHLRELWIWMKSGTFKKSVMRALVEGVKKVSGMSGEVSVYV